MRLTKPRITPQGEAEWDEEIRPYINPHGQAEQDVHNIFKTLARHPKLAKAWMVFGNHILNKSSLPEREREILILRIGWLRQAGYEFGQHRCIGRAVGLSEAEISAIVDGPDNSQWNGADATLLRAVDELCGDSFIGDDTWSGLSRRFDTKALLDLVFTVGNYTTLSMAVNS
jgi:alkylhydroperoxidase family enzyme